jgi:hypothetical protein
MQGRWSAHRPEGRWLQIHHLRHTFVSETHEAGLTAGVIRAHMGHVQEPTMLH